MKQLLIAFAVAGLFLTSCEKDPDFDKMSTDLTVYTDYDSKVDFKNAKTYFIPDSIYSPSSVTSERWIKGKTADAIVGEIVKNLNAQGYTRITDDKQKDNADVGVQVTLINRNVQVSGIVGGDYYPWWGAGFWGGWWSGYYYPYGIPVTYSYNTGSLVMEMVNLQNKDSKELPIVWRSNCKGLFSGNTTVDVQLIQRAVDQAFNQPPFALVNGNVNRNSGK